MSQAREAGLTPVLDPDTFAGYWSPVCGNRWECYFEPFSPCQAWYAAHRHEIDAVRGYDGKHTLPGLTSEQKLHHISALAGEILRPNARVRALLENQTFDVGVHIRRGDKLIREALYFSTNEYFNHVDNFVHPDRNYHGAYGEKYNKAVFVATDDVAVIEEVKRYPQYSIKVTTDPGGAVTGKNLDVVLHDLFALASAGALVGTFSSHITRLAAELHAARGSSRTTSLDEMYYAYL